LENPTNSLAPAEEEEDALKTYRKMKAMLPEGAVRQKMVAQGFTDEEVTSFLQGGELSVPSEEVLIQRQQMRLLQMKTQISPKQQPSVSTVSPVQTVRTNPTRRLSVIEELQSGPKLKPLEEVDKRQKAPTPKTKAMGLLGALATAMAERRVHLQMEDEHADSDSSGGWSDTDSD
jgi:hypothetical protein